MRCLPRLHINQIGYVLLVGFLFQLTAFTPAAAQTEDPPPPSSDTDLPDMAFQPPADADSIEDFVPPGITLVKNDTPKAENAVFPLTPGTGNALAFNQDRIAVIMEPETVPQATVLKFAELAASTTLSQEVDLVEPDPTYTLQFQIEAVDPGAADEVQALQKMSRIVVDMRHFGIDLDEVGGYFYLAYQDENQPDVWIEVPTDTHDRQGLISAEVSHFSNWQSGWRPEAWALEWRPPAVNEFTGAASYQYPFNVPPGRAGLQPTVALSYNSASLRGAIRQVSYARWPLAGH